MLSHQQSSRPVQRSHFYNTTQSGFEQCTRIAENSLREVWGVRYKERLEMIGLAVSVLIATSPVPVMDVLQIYGRLAGPECFGKTVPVAAGASCQLTSERIRETVGDVSEAGFEARLAALPFRWPLKPYGTAASPSNAKTVAINKNAETAVYMRELEQRRLYNRNDPTGPLPTSLRSTLDAQLSRESINPEASKLAFRALQNAPTPLDWFSFLERIGAEQVVWPRY